MNWGEIGEFEEKKELPRADGLGHPPTVFWPVAGNFKVAQFGW